MALMQRVVNLVVWEGFFGLSAGSTTFGAGGHRRDPAEQNRKNCARLTETDGGQ